MEPIDISFGGLRIHSNEAYRVGAFLRLDVFFPRVAPVTFTTEIMWIDTLSEAAPARFDVGLSFVELNPGALNLLLSVLSPKGEAVRTIRPSAPEATRRITRSFEDPSEPVSEIRPVMPASATVRKALDAGSVFSRTPIVVVDVAELRAMPLDARCGFLVSLIDGITSVETIVDLSGMATHETLALLEELRARQIIELC